MAYLGNFALGDTVDFKFTTIAASTGAPTTLAGTPSVACYVANSTTEITAGITLTADFDSRTGLNHVRVVVSSGNGYTSMSSIDVVVTAGTVGGQSIVGYVVGSFSIDARSLAGGMPVGVIPSLNIIENGIAQSVTGTTLVMRSATAFADSELVGALLIITSASTGAGQRRVITANVGSTKTVTVDTWTTTPTGTVTYAIYGTARGSSAIPDPVNAVQVGSQTASASGTVTFPNATLASTTNITAGTITTATNLTNAPTNGDLTATMKTSVAAAVLDVAASSHNTASTIGAAINAAGTAGDPWTTALPGSYTTGQAGAIVGALKVGTGATPALGIIDAGTAQSVTATTIVIRSAASFEDGVLVGATVVITGGSTGVGQRRLITANVGSTDTCTVDTWTTTPTGTITYEIFASAPGSSTSAAPVNVVQWNGTAVSSPATAGIPDVNVKNINNVATTSVTTINANQGTTQPLNFTGTSTSALVKTDVVDFGGTAGTFTSGKPDVQNVAGSVTGSVGSVTGAVGSVTGNLGGNVVGSIGSVGSGGITNASLAADTGLKPIRTGTAQAGASTSITLDAGASAVDSFYLNDLVYITGGTGAGQSRYITGYTGSTKVATVTAWATNPNNTSTFAILPGDAIPGATAPTSAQNADAVWNRLTSAITTVGSVGAAVVTNLDAQVSKTVQPVVAGRQLAIDASGHASINWADVAGASTAVNLSGTTVNAVTNAPTAGDLTATMKTSVENAVLDATAASHNTAGTIGAKINSAASAGDPLANPDGTYGAGTIGALIQNSVQAGDVVPANVKKINDVTITGGGVSGNPFEP